MSKGTMCSDANTLFNSVLSSFNNSNSHFDETAEIGPLIKRQKKSKAEIAYEKFTESMLNENETVNKRNVELKSEAKVLVSANILDKIQNIEHKLATTEAIWGNALKQLTALHELAQSVKKVNDNESSKLLLGGHKILIVLPTLPVKAIGELIELDKAITNSKTVAQSVKNILEDGDDTKYHDNHLKFITWSIGKLITPGVATYISWSTTQKGFQLKNSSFLKILIKHINLKFPMLAYIYVVEQILIVLNKLRIINPKI